MPASTAASSRGRSAATPGVAGAADRRRRPARPCVIGRRGRRRRTSLDDRPRRSTRRLLARRRVVVLAGGFFAVAAVGARSGTSAPSARRAALDAERAARRRRPRGRASSELLESTLEPRGDASRLTGLLVPALADVAGRRPAATRRVLRRGVAGRVRPGVAEDLLAPARRRIRSTRRATIRSRSAPRTRAPLLAADSTECPTRPRATPGTPSTVAHVRYASGLPAVPGSSPLIGRVATFGALSFVRRDGPPAFTDDEVRARPRARPPRRPALDNARLFDDVRRAEAQLEAIIENLAEAVTASDPTAGPRLRQRRRRRVLAARRGPPTSLSPGRRRAADRLACSTRTGARSDCERAPGERALAGETPEPAR